MAATVAQWVAAAERAAGVADLRLPVQREAAGRVLQLAADVAVELVAAMHVLGREHRVKAALQRHRLPRAEAAPPSRRGGRLRVGRRQREHEAQRLLRPLGDRAASSAEDGLALLHAEELGHQRACLVWKELLVEPVKQEAQELLRVLLPPRGEEVAVRPHGLHEGVRRLGFGL